MSRKSGSSVASIKRYFEPSAAEGSVQLPVGLSFGINPTIFLELFWILQALGRKSLAKGVSKPHHYITCMVLHICDLCRLCRDFIEYSE